MVCSLHFRSSSKTITSSHFITSIDFPRTAAVVPHNLFQNKTKQHSVTSLEAMDLSCASCGCNFAFHPNEQIFYELKGFVAPKKCQLCRANARLARKYLRGRLSGVDGVLTTQQLEIELLRSQLNQQQPKIGNDDIDQNSNNQKNREICRYFMKTGYCRHGEKCRHIHANNEEVASMLLKGGIVHSSEICSDGSHDDSSELKSEQKRTSKSEDSRVKCLKALSTVLRSKKISVDADPVTTERSDPSCVKVARGTEKRRNKKAARAKGVARSDYLAAVEWENSAVAHPCYPVYGSQQDMYYVYYQPTSCPSFGDSYDAAIPILPSMGYPYGCNLVQTGVQRNGLVTFPYGLQGLSMAPVMSTKIMLSPEDHCIRNNILPTISGDKNHILLASTKTVRDTTGPLPEVQDENNERNTASPPSNDMKGRTE